jgi:anthranilate synthase/aminodeoxychorismate synthase-like glutamine amidotransferase
MILMVDNYDSFTYNLVQFLGEMGEDLMVFRNDKVTTGRIARLAPELIVISPGPGGPRDAGVSREVIRRFAGRIPVLGVCLGHQCIGDVFGGRVRRAGRIMHGKTSPVYHDGQGLFRGLPDPFEAARYHSLLVERKTLPACLRMSAWTEEGEVMGLRHTRHPVEGVQFHPESVMTPTGKALLRNAVANAKAWNASNRRGRG